MPSYSPELKEHMVCKMVPPSSLSVLRSAQRGCAPREGKVHRFGAPKGLFAATFGETNGFAAVSGPLGGFQAQHGHAFEVPRQANQRPFVAHMRQPAQ